MADPIDPDSVGDSLFPLHDPKNPDRRLHHYEQALVYAVQLAANTSFSLDGLEVYTRG